MVERVLPDQDTLCIAFSAKLLDTLEGLYPFPLQHQAYKRTAHLVVQSNW